MCLFTFSKYISSVQSLSRIWLFQPHESQHARPPCPSPTPGVHSDSRPSSQWCHPAISFSVVPFSSCPQSLPASESFPMSQLFAWGGQSTGVSAIVWKLKLSAYNCFLKCLLKVLLLQLLTTNYIMMSHKHRYDWNKLPNTFKFSGNIFHF